MKNVFINGLNSKVGGGKSYLTNFLKLLQNHKKSDNYYVLVPNGLNFEVYNSEKIKVFCINPIFSNLILIPITYIFAIPILILKYRCDVIFNLGDVPILTLKKQIMHFDWPYGLYPKSYAWKLMSKSELFKRKTKLFFIKLLCQLKL